YMCSSTCICFGIRIIRGAPMPGVLNNVPRLALFLAGLAAGALTGQRRGVRGSDSANGDSPQSHELKAVIERLEARIAEQADATSVRFEQVDARLNEHAARLTEVPTTTQIAAAMEQVLARSMASLDERLTAQAHSIETLKMTVAQTDGLLERV